MQAYNLLSNGMGGIDWAGLPLVVAHLGIERIDVLIDTMATIKTHQPREDEAPADDPLGLDLD